MLLSFYVAPPTLNLTSFDPGIKWDCLMFEVKERKLTCGNKHQVTIFKIIIYQVIIFKIIGNVYKIKNLVNFP